MLFFDILWTTDAAICLAILYFFLINLSNGSIAARYMFAWPAVAALLVGILTTTYWLQYHQNEVAALILLAGFSTVLLFTGLRLLITITGGNRRLN